MFLQTPPALVLASTSLYRRTLLERLGVPFECQAPGIDEQPHEGEPPAALVRRLALAKASAVAARRPDAWVIGSDQIAVLGEPGAELILGKPGSPARAIEQLRACSGHTVRYLTAVALVRARDDARSEFLDTTHVRFRSLDEATIARYVQRESPLDCAGAFKSEALGIALCAAIETSDPTALVGLPLIELSERLRRAGFAVP